MKPDIPFPDPPREILPGRKKLLAFKAFDVAAILFRAFAWPRRALLRRREAAAVRAGAAPRVVIFEPFGMGDVFLLQPLVRAWLDKGASVVVACRKSWTVLFPPHERLSFLPLRPRWADPDAKRKMLKLPFDVVSAAFALRKVAAGAHCIDPRGDIRSVMAFWLAGAGEVFTLPRYYSANDCPVSPRAATTVPLDRMASRRIVSRAFAPEGVPYGHATLEHLAAPPIFPPDAVPGRIGFIPMASIDGKKWQPPSWHTLALALRERGFRPTMLCGPNEKARARFACGEPAIECLVAETPADWIRVLGSCRAIVSVNTGPMHFADALGIPLVVIDGPSRLPLWAPEGERSLVLHHQDRVPWVPVHFGNDFDLREKVMALVTPVEVLSGLERLGAIPPVAPAV